MSPIRALFPGARRIICERTKAEWLVTFVRSNARRQANRARVDGDVAEIIGRARVDHRAQGSLRERGFEMIMTFTCTRGTRSEQVQRRQR